MNLPTIPPQVKEIISDPFYQVAFMLFLFQAAFVSTPSQWADTQAYFDWSQYIVAHGIGNIYTIKEPVCNYPPVISYILFLFAKLAALTDYKNFKFFKLVGLAADYGVAIILVKMLHQKRKEIMLLLLLIANPVFIYNSYCWGQVDGILAFFIFLSFVFMLRERLLVAVFFFTLALNFKAHAIIFVPPFLLLSYHIFNRRMTVKKLFSSVAVFVILQTLILLPFILEGQLANALKVFSGSVDFYQAVSFNAYNLWYLLLDCNVWVSDKLEWHGINYQHWGLLMFFTLSIIALLPLFVSAISRNFKKNFYEADTNVLFLTFALIPLLFFYVNTQMHERFGHTCILFTAAFAFSTRKYWLFLIVCLAYFGNMEGVLHYFQMPNSKILLLHPVWAASLYLVLILALFYYLYRPFITQLKQYRHAENRVG